METAAIIGALIGAYVTILGCYIFTFTLWANMSARVDLLMAQLTKQIADSMAIINAKLDRVCEDVAAIKGRQYQRNQDDSDVRRT